MPEIRNGWQNCRRPILGQGPILAEKMAGQLAGQAENGLISAFRTFAKLQLYTAECSAAIKGQWEAAVWKPLVAAVQKHLSSAGPVNVAAAGDHGEAICPAIFWPFWGPPRRMAAGHFAAERRKVTYTLGPAKTYKKAFS